MKKKYINISVLTGILLLGFFFRFYNLNWDQGHHLHPDERFLTMVGNAMIVPNNFYEYLDPTTSKLNPSNIGFPFFVYGAFPVILNKLVALVLNNDNYNSFTIQGRALSAFFDFLIILLVFKTAYLLEKKLQLNTRLKYFAAFFYAISVLPIQLSHFFAVDTFLNFFMFLSFYLALRFNFSKNLFFALGSGIALGFALGSKINGLFIFPLILLLILAPHLLILKKVIKTKKNIVKYLSILVAPLILFLLFTYLTFRLSSPYQFESGFFLDITVNSKFLNNIQTLKSLSDPNTTFPPSLQWIGKTPILFSLYNIALFGLGLPIFILAVIGIITTMRRTRFLLIFIAVWLVGIFIFQSLQFVQSMRYFLFLYPFIAIFSGMGISYLLMKQKLSVLIIPLTVFWPLLFFSIYATPHSRVQASHWIYNNVPPNSIILAEHWDDALPLIIDGQQHPTEQLNVFDLDTDEKWSTMNAQLKEADYLILSSGRGYESILNVRERYPRMSKFYEDLFNGETNFTKIAEFTSYPSLKYIGIPITIPDDTAEEAFRVNDHPRVIIFKRQSL